VPTGANAQLVDQFLILALCVHHHGALTGCYLQAGAADLREVVQSHHFDLDGTCRVKPALNIGRACAFEDAMGLAAFERQYQEWPEFGHLNKIGGGGCRCGLNDATRDGNPRRSGCGDLKPFDGATCLG